jgi:hypothetical protein
MVDLAPLTREGDEGEVDAIEHELNRHEDGDDVAFDEKRGDTNGEKDRTEDEVVRDGDHYFGPPVFFLAAEAARSERITATAQPMKMAT